MYVGSREIGQPGSYLAQASFRKFVCVRGSVSSVLRCVRGRNEYRNNVSMGMTRRSFYLLNLSDESLGMGAGRTEKAEKEARKRKERRKGRVNEERRRRRRRRRCRWRYDSSFSVYCQYSHRAVLKASRISIYLFEARKRDSLRLPRFEWCTGCWIMIKREMHFLLLRATTHLRNVAECCGSLADVLSEHHDFVSMTTRMRMVRKNIEDWVSLKFRHSRAERMCRNFKADSIGSVDRVVYLATSSLLLMRRERMHVFHGVW